LETEVERLRQHIEDRECCICHGYKTIPNEYGRDVPCDECGGTGQCPLLKELDTGPDALVGEEEK